MQPAIIAQLGVEGRDEHPSRSAQHGPAVDLGEDLDALTDGLDDGRPDEHGMEGPASEAGDVEVGLEGLPLAAEGVAPHDEVDGAEALVK